MMQQYQLFWIVGMSTISHQNEELGKKAAEMLLRLTMVNRKRFHIYLNLK